MAVEEGVKVAGSVVDALKNQPSTFAMIVISFALLFFLWYSQSSSNQQKGELVQLILEHQRETAAMLAKCVEPSQVATIIDQLGRDRNNYVDSLQRNYEATRSNASELQKFRDEITEMLRKPPEQR